MNNFIELDHPVLKHKLSTLRDINTDATNFRSLMKEMGKYLAFEASRNLELETYDLETPVAKTKGDKVKRFPVCVSILRAGNGLLDGVLETLPYAPAGHIGIYRDKFIDNTVEYYFKLPDQTEGEDIYLIDPMVATGDTTIAALDRLKQHKVKNITVLCVLISPLAIERLSHFHPDVKVITICKEEGLNDDGYLLPGMGDAGNRLYNTK